MLNDSEKRCHIFGDYWDVLQQQCISNQYEVAICNDYFTLPRQGTQPLLASEKYRADPIKQFVAQCRSLGNFPTYAAAKQRLFAFSTYDGIWCEPRPTLDTPCMGKITDDLSGDIAVLAPHEVPYDTEPQYGEIDETKVMKTQKIMGRLFV